LYIIGGNDASVSSLIKITQDMKILSITAEKANDRVKSGVTIGLDIDNGKPAILVNTKSSVKEGRDFSLQFLSLVKVCNQ
jgi:hypothetical protein